MKENNENAFAVIVHRYRKQLYRQVYKRLGSEDDAQDILQDIYFSLWNNRLQISIDNSLLPYLSRSAHYAIIDHYLFHKKRFEMETTLAKRDEPLQLSVEESILAADMEQEFNIELLKMPLTVQQVFHLSRREGLSIKEIAVRLNLSEQTVKNYISTALQTLRVYIKKTNLTFFIVAAASCLFDDFKF